MERRRDDSFIAEFNKLLLPLWGLRAGLRTTLLEFFSKKVTLQYPEQEIHFAPIFRGKHSLLQEPGNKNDICIMCKMCERICPNECIEVVIEKTEDKKRHLKDYLLDLTKCLFCGLCQEVCPADCIILDGGDVAYASYSRDGLIFDRHGIEREASEEEWAAMLAKKAAKKKPAPKPAPKPDAKPDDAPKPEDKPAEAKAETEPVTDPKEIKTAGEIKTVEPQDIKTTGEKPEEPVDEAEPKDGEVAE